jgi:hypothetical protein
VSIGRQTSACLTPDFWRSLPFRTE